MAMKTGDSMPIISSIRKMLGAIGGLSRKSKLVLAWDVFMVWVALINLWMIVLAAVLVKVAAVAERLLLLLPSQTHGRLLPYETGTYTPTWVEYSIIVGLMALGALAMVAFFKVFPIMDTRDSDGMADASGRGLEEAGNA